jgi:hypothetical protein
VPTTLGLRHGLDVVTRQRQFATMTSPAALAEIDVDHNYMRKCRYVELGHHLKHALWRALRWVWAADDDARPRSVAKQVLDAAWGLNMCLVRRRWAVAAAAARLRMHGAEDGRIPRALSESFRIARGGS